MAFWLNLAWWGYVAMWGVLLIHCLLKRRFFPVFGPGLGTKVFWLATFVFMNPLLTLLYAVFGVIFKADEAGVRRIGAGGVTCLALVLVVIGVFEVPWPEGQKNEITILHAGQPKQNEEGFGLHAQAGVLEAKNSLSTSTSSTTSGHTKFCAASIVIRSESNHLLIDKVCRFMQEKIAKLPYVERVEYWPSGIEMNDPLSRADIIIVVDGSKISEGGFGIERKLEADISCTAGTEPVEKSSHTHYHNTPPVLHFSMSSHLQHSSTFKGLESSKAKYKQQSENIGQQFVEAITKQFDKWIEQYGLLPELPAYMYGEPATEVEFEFLKDKNAKQLHLSGGLLTNCRAVWSYEDERANVDAFRDVRDILRERGWHGGQELDKEIKHKLESLTMSKADDHIQVFRMRGRGESGGVLFGDQEGLQKKLPIIVEYLSLFTKEQADDALRRLFGSDADLETKLIFDNFSSSENVKQLLFDSVESQPVKTMGGFLLLGRHYAGKEDIAKATQALMMARVMARAESEHNPAGNEIKELAKKIGDESLATANIGIEHYQLAGFIDVSTLEGGAVYELAIGEPLMFYTLPAEQEVADKDDIKTIVMRIRKVVGTEDQYEVEKIEKQRSFSSRGKNGLNQRIFLGDSMSRDESLSLKVENLEGKKFRLTVRKG